jgi:FtsH-binding integral membrane protein
MRLTLLLMLLYLALTAVLATQVDRRFFVNDGLGVVIFGVLLAGLLFAGERPRVRRRS